MSESTTKSKTKRRFDASPESGSLPFDAAKAAKHLSASDKTMAKIIKSVGPCRLELQEMQNAYESLMESIVYQQLTGKAAATIMGRVKGLYKNKFPSPVQLLKTSDEDLRAVGLSGAKTAAIKDLSLKKKEGLIPEVEQMEKMSDEEIIEILSSVRGIGEWTVQMLLIFRLGRPDVMPHNDYGVRKGFARAYNLEELPKPKELLTHSEIWRPYRSVAAWYLWRVLDT
ncbi:MAG: DNA-3-methyladenine glycosylase [Candidatus Obscuribacterales bacterium]|nr:DNA-3-methyladenine glycosylase [Candidatus Obscuribacterales bacterium]